MTEQPKANALVEGKVREAWDGGGVVDMRVEAIRPVNGWSIDVNLGGEIVNIWNARILAREGNTYRLGPVDYNVQIPKGIAIELGVQVEGPARFVPLAIAAERADEVAARETARSPVPEMEDTPPANVMPENGGGLGPQAELLQPIDMRYYDAPGTGPAALNVEARNVERPQGTRDGLPQDDFAPGPFATQGNMIVDSAGERAPIHGVNWFGFETPTFAPHGLWVRNWRALMDEAKSLGFNAMRLPLSGELVAQDGGTPNGIDYRLNPDLEGLNGLEILDAIVDYADRIGLRILLDYHRGEPGGGPNDNGLWFGGGRTEADIIAEWRTLAERYGDAPAVIGADLMNEPHMATWGDDTPTDWAAAAGRIGDAILDIAPDWLIVVEGVSAHDGRSYWWGGNLTGVRDHPVSLEVPNRLVYSPHDYPASVAQNDWFADGSTYEDLFERNWGYIARDGIAPVVIGEWGSLLATPEDREWAHALSTYLQENAIPWFWWSLNPNSGDTGGVLEDDWTTVRPAVATLLEPFLSETRPARPFVGEGPVSEVSATFTLTLAQPAEADVAVTYATTDGTAKAGEDYVPAAGTLAFAAGETEKAVSVPVLPDAEADGDAFFYMVLSGPAVAATSATALIEGGARTPGALPTVDVADTVVAEDAAARFRVVLSEPAPRDVAIGYRVAREGATAEPPARGSFTVPQGARDVVVEVDVDHRAAEAGELRYRLELTSADGATLQTAEAIAVVPANPPTGAAIELAGSGDVDASVTLEIVKQQDWGGGAQYSVLITNVSDRPITGWQVSLDLPFDIAKLWSASLVADEGARVSLRNIDWNGAIAPGESVDFGLIADEGGMPLGEVLQGADIEILVQ